MSEDPGIRKRRERFQKVREELENSLESVVQLQHDFEDLVTIGRESDAKTRYENSGVEELLTILEKTTNPGESTE